MKPRHKADKATESGHDQTEPRRDKVAEKAGADKQSEGPLACASLTEIDVIAMANNMAKVGISESEEETLIADKMKGGKIEVEKHMEKLDDAVTVGMRQSDERIKPKVQSRHVQQLHKEGTTAREANSMGQKAKVSASGQNSENAINSSKSNKMAAENKTTKNIHAKKNSDEKSNKEREHVENSKENLVKDKSTIKNKSKYSEEDEVKTVDTFGGKPVAVNGTNKSKVGLTRNKKTEDKSKPDTDSTVDNIKTKFSKSDRSCSSKMNKDARKANVKKRPSADKSKELNKQMNIRKSEFKAESNTRSVKHSEYSAGDKVTKSSNPTTDKKNITVLSHKEAYEDMLSSMKDSKIKRDNRNNNGNLKRMDTVENDKSSENNEKGDRVENIGNPIVNNRAIGDKVKTVKDLCGRTGSFDFKDYLEASYTKDCAINKPIEEEFTVTQKSKKTATQQLCPSQYLNLNLSTVQRRPYTAELYDPRMDVSDSRGSRYQCKSAFTRAPPSMSANTDYYSVQRSKHFPKRIQANAATVLSTSLRQTKKQKNETLVGKTDLKPGDEKGNRINVYLCGKAIESPRDKPSEGPVASGDKTDNESLSKDAAENWATKETFRMKKRVEEQHIDDEIVSETNEQMERLSKLASENPTTVGTKKPYVVTSHTLDKIKDLQDRYGQHKKMKETKMIDKDVSDLEVLKDKSGSDIDKSDTDSIADQLVRKTSSSIVIPCESLHTSIESASVGEVEPVNDNSAANIQAPSYGSSSSCAPDMYDMYARKPKPKTVMTSPVKKPPPTPNFQNFNAQIAQKTAVGGEKKSVADTKCSIPKETKEETYTLKYTHAPSGDPETSTIPMTPADKVFRDLLTLCQDMTDTDITEESTKESSHSGKNSTCHDCILCQATTISAGDKDKILNQLAFHVMEKMKDLNMKTEEKDKIVSQEEDKTKDEDNTTEVKVGLLDKLNWFGTDAVIQGKERDNDVTEDRDEQMDSVNTTEREKEYDCNLKAQSFFVPVNQPVFSKISKQGPLQKLREKACSPPKTEPHMYDSKSKTDRLFSVPRQMQGKGMNNEKKHVAPIEPVIVPQMEEEKNLNPDEDDEVHGSFEDLDMQRIPEKKQSAKQLNMDLTLDESSDNRSVSAKAFTKNARPKSSRNMFCPMSIRHSMVEEQMEKHLPKSIAASAKSAKAEEKSEKTEKSHWQSSRLVTQEASLKFISQAKPDTKKQRKNAKKPKSEIGNKERTEYLEDSVVVPLRQLSSSGSIGKKNEDSDVKAKRLLRNRTSKSARTAAEATEQQNQLRGRRYEERQKRKVNNKVLDSVNSVAESTFHGAVKPDAPLNSRQKKLRVFLQSQLRKKREAVWKRTVVSAPSQVNRVPASGNQSNNHFSKGSSQKEDRQTTLNQCAEIATSKRETNKMDQSSCLDKHKGDNTGVDLNLNNNTNRETGERDMAMEGNIVPPQIDHMYNAEHDETGERDMAMEGYIVPPQIDHMYNAEHDESSDSKKSNFDIELDVDEVIDWEFPSNDATRAVDEITYTITHTDGTQLIVSNKHPDFENIVKFIEEKKSLNGEDSITIEAELNLNQAEEEASNDEIGINGHDLSLVDSDVKIEDGHVTESCTKLDKNVGSVQFNKLERNTSLQSDESHRDSSDTEGKTLHLNSPKHLNVHATSVMPVEHPRRDSDSYSIHKTLRDLIPEEMITKGFTEEDSRDLNDYKGTSLLTGEECKHHDNIFEAFDTSIFGAERGANVLCSTDNDSAIADIWSSDSQETVTEQDWPNKDVYELLPNTSTSSFIKSEEFENVIRDANPWTVEKIDVLSSYGNEMMAECEIKDANVLQKGCVTNLLNKRANAVSEKDDIQRGQLCKIGPERKEGLLCLSEDNNNLSSLVEDTELYEVLHVPEYSSDASMVIVVESGAKIEISGKVTQEEETNERDEVSSSVQDKEMSIPVLIAEAEISVPVIVSSHSNQKCSSQPDVLVNDLNDVNEIKDVLCSSQPEALVNEIKDVEDVLDQGRSKLTAENTASSIKYNVGEIDGKDNGKQGQGHLNEVNDEDTGASEGSFSDFEETLYDQDDIIVGYKDDCDDNHSNEASKTSTGKMIKKKRTKCIRKSAQEVLDNLERSIEKSFSEFENQDIVDIKGNLDRRSNEKSVSSEAEKQNTDYKNIVNNEINDDKKCIKNESGHASRKGKGRRKSSKLVCGDEGYDEEEDRRREIEEQIAAEGFIKTQQKYMQIVLNNSVESQRGKGETLGLHNAAIQIQSRYMVGILSIVFIFCGLSVAEFVCILVLFVVLCVCVDEFFSGKFVLIYI